MLGRNLNISMGCSGGEAGGYVVEGGIVFLVGDKPKSQVIRVGDPVNVSKINEGLTVWSESVFFLLNSLHPLHLFPRSLTNMLLTRLARPRLIAENTSHLPSPMFHVLSHTYIFHLLLSREEENYLHPYDVPVSRTE